MHPATRPVPSTPPRGGALVLVPGIVCDRAVWGARSFPASLRVQTARSTSRVRIRLGAMAERVLAAAPATFALAGHSMGGRVALEIMRRAPERVERIALLDTGWRARPEDSAGEDERAGRYALLAIARKEGMRAMDRAWAQRMVHPSRLTDTGLIDAILDMIDRQTPDRFALQIEALLTRPDAGDVLRGIRCPALVLCGRQDAWSGLAQHEEIAAMIPDARLVAIDDCGHMATMEQPGLVAEALLKWLDI